MFLDSLKKPLNRAVLQTANLSKVVKRRRGKMKKKMSIEEGNGEKDKTMRRRRKRESGRQSRSVRKEQGWRERKGRNWKMNER